MVGLVCVKFSKKCSLATKSIMTEGGLAFDLVMHIKYSPLPAIKNFPPKN